MVTRVLLNVALIWATPLATFRRTARLPPRLATRQLLHALLAGDRLTGAFPGTSIGPCPLASNRKMRPMAHPAIAADVLESGDVRLQGASKLALNLVVSVDDAADPGDLLFSEVLGLRANRDLRFLQDIKRELRADSVNVA